MGIIGCAMASLFHACLLGFALLTHLARTPASCLRRHLSCLWVLWITKAPPKQAKRGKARHKERQRSDPGAATQQNNRRSNSHRQIDTTLHSPPLSALAAPRAASSSDGVGCRARLWDCSSPHRYGYDALPYITLPFQPSVNCLISKCELDICSQEGIE